MIIIAGVYGWPIVNLPDDVESSICTERENLTQQRKFRETEAETENRQRLTAYDAVRALMLVTRNACRVDKSMACPPEDAFACMVHLQ